MLLPGTALAQGWALVPPVDAPVVRSFEHPGSPFGPGHRGIDYGVPEGSEVRAAAAGTVTFAGAVAGDPAVTIDHGGGLETTYSVLGHVGVSEGQEVRAGSVIGSAGTPHGYEDAGLHLGVKLDGRYVDPKDHLVSVDPSDAIRLIPVQERPLEVIGIYASMPTDLPLAEDCRPRYDLEVAAEPPNDNVAVAIPGINSSSFEADLFDAPPELLGYPSGRVYRFSYRGSQGASLHTRYHPEDTWGDINVYAKRLATMLRKIKRLYPDRGVDLIAHSQGGLVARAFLEKIADPSDRSLPLVENLVTLATPHEGAPLAEEAVQLEQGLGYTHLVGKGISEAGKKGWVGVPDIFSIAVSQMAGGSTFIEQLAAPDSLFGTRYLSLAAPGDPIVPATRTQVDHATNRTVRFDWGIHGHSSITRSTQARAIAYDFLRGTPDACVGSSETWGNILGTAIVAGESVASEAVGVGTSFIPGAFAAAATHGAIRVKRDPSRAGAVTQALLQDMVPTRQIFNKVRTVVRGLKKR